MKTYLQVSHLRAFVVLLGTLSTQSLHAQASLSLDGAAQYVQVQANTNFTPTNITLEAWVYPTNASCNTILSRGDGGITNLTDYIFDVGYDGTNCGVMKVCFYSSGAWDASSNTVPLNTWTHVAVTYDGTNKLLYINGVLDATAVRTNSLHSAPTAPLYIGRQGSVCNCNFFNGQLAEVRLWNTVRTASQVQSDMTYSSGAQAGLVAYYHLDEGSGTNADDASSNGNTGTLEGGASWSSLAPPLGQSVVTSIADRGPGTLRLAMAEATNGEAITFAPNLSGMTITLASTLTINTNLTIDASALPGGIQINGNGAVQVFNIPSNPSLTNVILNSLSITNGYATQGGGVGNSGVLTLNQCTVSGNRGGSGGGINSGGALTLNQCTVSGNTAGDGAMTGYGGGIYGGGSIALNQCTVSGNHAGYGGGIAYSGGNGIMLLNECTVSGNSSGGIWIIVYGAPLFPESLVLTNTIVAANAGGILSLPDICTAPYSVLTYGGSNLVQSINNFGTTNGPAPLTNAPDLLPLRNYGGPTQTMPPRPGSPAIGAGSAAANSFVNDQRGYPRLQNGLIDLGAVELPIVQPFTPYPTKGLLPLTVQFSSTNADSDGSTIVGRTWSFGDGNASAVQNPTNIYGTAGPFSPGLIVTNSLGLALSVSGRAVSVYRPLVLAGVNLSGTALVLSGSNGVSGLAYTVLTSTNLNLSLGQWTPLVTNTWSANGPFSLTVTNALILPVPGRFFLLGAP